MAWKLLFGSDFGLMSLATISFVIVMAVYFMVMFAKKVEEDARNAKQ